MSPQHDFLALDKLTLSELEAIFAQHKQLGPKKQAKKAVKPDGQLYDSIPGAVFYELEDLH